MNQNFYIIQSTSCVRVFLIICRSLFVVLGVGGFVVSKNSVDKKRYESMKVRERMRKSNDGDYEDFQDTKRFDI